MQSFISPNGIFLLTVSSVMLFLLSVAGTRSGTPTIVMGFCLLAAGYGLISLRANLWALLVVGMSPLPFLYALRQTGPSIALLLMADLMLTAGAVFLFTDPNGRPSVSYGLAGLAAALCGEIMWIGAGRRQNAEGAIPEDESVVGMIGTADSDIEDHTAGSVVVNRERWMARSKRSIPKGGTVRVLRGDGFVLAVRQEEGLAKNQDRNG